jgi:hypothetical protein
MVSGVVRAKLPEMHRPGSTWLSPAPAPNETVEKVYFSPFLRKTSFENQELMSNDFQVLEFFDSLNNGMEPTRRSARLMPGGAMTADVKRWPQRFLGLHGVFSPPCIRRVGARKKRRLLLLLPVGW